MPLITLLASIGLWCTRPRLLQVRGVESMISDGVVQGMALTLSMLSVALTLGLGAPYLLL